MTFNITLLFILFFLLLLSVKWEDHQKGFIKGRSITDQIFILKQAISKYFKYNKQFLSLFMDFRKAYDSLRRKNIWGKMVSFDIPRKLIKLAGLRAKIVNVK